MLPSHIGASRRNPKLVIFHLKTCIVFSHGGVQVFEVACGDGVWHVKQWLPSLHIHCFTLQKTTKKYYKTWIISKKTLNGIPTPTF